MKGILRMSKKNKKPKKGKLISIKQQNGGIREGAGRPAINPDDKFWEDAESLAKMQCTRDEIAGFLKIDSDTLVSKIKAHYNSDFSAWYSKYSYGGKACLRRRLYHQAMEDGKDSVKAAIWLSKNYLNMREPESRVTSDNNTLIKRAYSKEDIDSETGE